MDSSKLKTGIIILAATLGLAAGVIISGLDSKSKCEKVEDAIQRRSEVKGAVACFPPGVIGVNQSKEIKEGADLKCTCRRSYKGKVSYWAINKANR